MNCRTALLILAGATGCASALFCFQRPFREYPGMEYNNFPLPADYQEKTEFVFARLMHPDAPGGFGAFGRSRRGGADWRRGYTWWTIGIRSPESGLCAPASRT